jgi:transcription initiation factor TFIIE subunit alpha
MDDQSMGTIKIDVIRQLANVVGGAEAVDIAIALYELEEATSDRILQFVNKLAHITDRPDLKLKDVRRILFQLYNNSIIQCDRSRDPSSGWFVFHWRLQHDQVEGVIKNHMRRILRILSIRRAFEETNEFYHCQNQQCPRITFEDAMELIFRCPTCGTALQHVDNSEAITTLSAKIAQIEQACR